VLTNLSIGLLWLVAIVQGAIIVALVHQLDALRAIANAGAPVASKLPVGAEAPEFSALELQSNHPVHSSIFRGRRIVLCFMNADCHACRALAFELSQKSADTLSGLVIYYDAAVTSVGAVFQALAAKVPVLCKEAIDVSMQFGLDKFPVSVIIDESWRIAGTGNPLRADDLLASLTEAVEQARTTASPLTPLTGQS
jgi:hypothetical protein